MFLDKFWTADTYIMLDQFAFFSYLSYIYLINSILSKVVVCMKYVSTTVTQYFTKPLIKMKSFMYFQHVLSYFINIQFISYELSQSGVFFYFQRLYLSDICMLQNFLISSILIFLLCLHGICYHDIDFGYISASMKLSLQTLRYFVF